MLLVSAMTAGSLTALADQTWYGSTIDSSRTGEIRVKLEYNNSPLSGIQLRMFRVADVSTAGQYTLIPPFDSANLGGRSLEGLIDGNASALNEELSGIFRTIALDNSSTATSITRVTASNGTAVFEDLPLGLYLLIQTGPANPTRIMTPLLLPMPLRLSPPHIGYIYLLEGEPKISTTTTPPGGGGGGGGGGRPPTDNTVVPDDDGFVELDPEEVPLVVWTPDPEDEDEWLVFPLPPLDGTLPQTGLDHRTTLIFLGSGLLMASAGLFQFLRKANRPKVKKRTGVIALTVGVIAVATSGALWLQNNTEDNEAGAFSAHVTQTLVEYIEITPQLHGSSAETPDVQTDGKLKYIYVDDTEYMGVLRIPSLSLSLPVNTKWSYPALQRTPCRYRGNLEDDSLVIIAHNYRSHFGNIGNMKLGETITMTDAEGTRHVYEVVRVETVAPTEVAPVVFSVYDLTLMTCTLGGQSRVIVRAIRV